MHDTVIGLLLNKVEFGIDVTQVLEKGAKPFKTWLCGTPQSQKASQRATPAVPQSNKRARVFKRRRNINY